jgi:hypothetical protein
MQRQVYNAVIANLQMPNPVMITNAAHLSLVFLLKAETLGHPLRNPPEIKTRVMETEWERNTNMPHRLQGNFTHYAIIY